ncbi:glycosyltransferase family 39 protein [Mesorhizobium sp. LHD-90]|uniref:ArnT family glycosyltransferase n=1 Tax=Mesorhizobium sp. LHD-90 TaxID=3071414 RepID=UPI0027E0100B|nr:glycosyltransferase family 39 protein [Mesorhizobium sp. LHD-90]MDQ6435672.1 glycosyltransferase family 39 protein [Mesorhizobium sp. LHD-90]
MIERLARGNGAVYLLLAAYFTVNVILRLLMPASLELDEGQQIFLAQWFALGYDTQPPFYNWVQYGVVQLLGSTVLAVSVLKNLMLFCSYLFYGLTASLVIRDRVLAVIATLGLITIPQIGFEAQRDLTHTVAVLLAACMFMYFFVAALQRPTALNYALAGLAIGIGVISKYNFVLLPGAAVAAAMADRDLRARLFDPRVLLTALVAAAVVAPHALWFADHVGEATTRTMGKLTEDADGGRLKLIGEGLVSLAGAAAAFALPTLLLFWIAFGKELFAAWKAESRWTRLIGRMFIIFAMFLVLVVLGGASNIKDRWLVPILFLLPLYLCAKLEASGASYEGAARRFGMIVLAIMAAVPLVLLARAPLGGMLGRYEKQNVPYGPAIAQILSSNRDRPAVVLTGDQQMAGNLRLHAGDVLVMVPDYDSLAEPYMIDATHPVLVTWRERGEAVPDMPEELTAWLDARHQLDGAASTVQEAALPYHYGREGDVYRFSYAWIYPAAK